MLGDRHEGSAIEKSTRRVRFVCPWVVGEGLRRCTTQARDADSHGNRRVSALQVDRGATGEAQSSGADE